MRAAYALCPTKGATGLSVQYDHCHSCSPSPLATVIEIPIWRMEVKNAMPFSKKWFATCMTPEACWLALATAGFLLSLHSHDSDLWREGHLERSVK